MKISRLAAFISLAFATATLAAQTTQRFTASKANEYALVYSLPATALNISIETVHSRNVPGEFHNYARRHLGISNAVTQESTTVDIKSISISTSGVPDADNRWAVQFKSGSSPFMLLTPEGIPLTVNTDVTADDEATEVPEATSAAPLVFETEVARQAMTQDMIRSSSTSKRAELAAQRIFELRDTRSELLSGQADNPPADGQAMKLVLDNLAAQEEALTAMFAGANQTWTDVRTITVVPDSAGIDNQVVARISPFDGILDADNLAGAPLYLTVKVVERGELPLTEKGEPKKFPKGGFAYNIPGTALVELVYNGRTVASQNVTLAQLGVTFGLDPALFSDKKAPSMLRLDPATGGVVLLAPVP